MVKTRQRSRSSSSTVANIVEAFGQCYTSSLDPISGKTMIRCGYQDCSYSTDKNSNFKRHLETMHQPLQPPVNCCGISFVTKGEYRFHTRSVHKDGHVCSTCYKIFNRKALLERHIAIHTGSKPYSCTFCEYASANKANVIRHIATHGNLASTLPIAMQATSTSPSSSSDLSPASSETSPPLQSASSSVDMPLALHSSDTKTTPTPKPEEGQVSSPPSSQETAQLSHSIDSILSKGSEMYPETGLPEKENQLFTNDTSPRTKTELNWSQLSSQNEGLGLQLQLQEQYKYNAWAQYQYQQQQQLPFFPGPSTMYNYNYGYYSQQHNFGHMTQYPQMPQHPRYSYEERLTGAGQRGGDLLPQQQQPQETRRIETVTGPVPDFLPRGLNLKKKSGKGAKKGTRPTRGNAAYRQDLANNESKGAALVVENQNEAQIDEDYYIPKKLRLSKKFEKANTPQ